MKKRVFSFQFEDDFGWMSIGWTLDTWMTLGFFDYVVLYI